MAQITQLGERRTSVDDVFDYLHKEILTLNLRPGDKISEAEVASRFGVSRQPVRDAFSRLANMDLLLIRPQRATEVKRFSWREIKKSRFIRASIEKEVLRLAAQRCTDETGARLDGCIAEQEAAIGRRDVQAFAALDYEFHGLLCAVAKVDFAAEVIKEEKAKVDRLCVLGLSKEDHMPELVEDHRAIATAVKTGDGALAVELGAKHLSRLDETIERISQANANYFEPADAQGI